MHVEIEFESTLVLQSMHDNDGYISSCAGSLVLCRSVATDPSKMYSPRKLVDCPTTNEYLANALRSCVAHRHAPPVDSNTHTMEAFWLVLHLQLL